MGEGRRWHRYVCPFSYCGGGTLTAWGIKRHVSRHVSRHMDNLHARYLAAPSSPLEDR